MKTKTDPSRTAGAQAAILIPARWKSKRFPGKPLHLLEGKPLIQHVWERCMRSRLASRVIVATDDMRIARAAFDFGAEVALTSARHPTGTDRIAEVAARLPSFPIIVNVQGDEPLIDPRLIDRLIATLRKHPALPMATAAVRLPRGQADDPAKVKVVTGLDGRALYFSRSIIPCDREGRSAAPVLHHFGIYAFRRKFLLEFVRWKQTPLEKLEKLEQLRAVEHGVPIAVLLASRFSPGVDTPADALEAANLLRSKKPLARRKRGQPK